MFDAYAAPEFEPDERPIPPLVHAAQAVLLVFGVLYVLIGVGLGVLYGSLGFVDPELPPVFGVMMGLMMFVCSGGFGVAMIASAVGLQARSKWAWVGALVVGGMFAGSACMPIGLFLLYAMLVEDTRRVYLG